MTTKKMYRYTKDTLLAFASLPSCQTRPDGIDPVLWRDSVNSDVVERNIAIPVVPPSRGLVRRDSDLAYSKSPVDDIPEWRRSNGGGAILQSGPRRKPYEEEPLGNAFSSSYPPRPSGPWVDQNGPIRPSPGPNVPPGRWDHRNGDNRDRERGRLPQEWDADEGGPGGKGDAGQRPWVERDGLLGSGNRPLPQGHNRIGRPADNYQPSRPLIKTPSYGRREDTDIVNDETFGFLETSNDDRSVEERKRRESFELMRKEQHRQLQEQKQPLTESDDSTVNRKHDENSLWDNNLSHQSPPLSPPPIGKTVVPPVLTPPRPAVPPGFSKVVQQRQTLLQQEDEAQGSLDPPKDASITDQTSLDSDKIEDSSSAHSSRSVADIKEVKCATLVAKERIIELDVVETKVVVTEAMEGSAVNGSLLPSLSGTRSRNVHADVWSFSLEAQDGDSISDILSTEDASSIRKESLLDKLFGNAAPTIIDDVVLPSDLLRDEPLLAAPEEDSWSESLSKTSKFAHWFHTEEDKFTTSQTNSSKNLMSLFGNTDDAISVKKDVPSTTTTTTTAPGIKSGFIPMPMGPSLEDIEKGLNHSGPKNGFIKRSAPVFMTCEDIEQALLAEAVGGDSRAPPPPPPLPPTVAAAPLEEIAPPKDAASASQHLLALLLKRPNEIDAADASNILGVEQQAWKKPEQTSQVHTLETLFNKAFMSELQSSHEPARMFPDESSEIPDAADFLPKPGSWFNSWNMWPDSKDVEAGGHPHHHHQPVPEEASAPPLPGLWGKNQDYKSNKPFPEVVLSRKPAAAFLRPQHIQPPSFQFPQPPQILQRPQFHYGMAMPEHDVLKPPQPQAMHWQQQQQQQQQQQPQPPFLNPPFQAEFQRPTTKGGYGGNSVDQWFGMDVRRGVFPNGVFPQAPLGIEGDMKLRYD